MSHRLSQQSAFATFLCKSQPTFMRNAFQVRSPLGRHAPVAVLLHHCRPSAVVGRIAFFVVDAVDCEFFSVTVRHRPTVEVDEVQPLVADGAITICFFMTMLTHFAWCFPSCTREDFAPPSIKWMLPCLTPLAVNLTINPNSLDADALVVAACYMHFRHVTPPFFQSLHILPAR